LTEETIHPLQFWKQVRDGDAQTRDLILAEVFQGASGDVHRLLEPAEKRRQQRRNSCLIDDGLDDQAELPILEGERNPAVNDGNAPAALLKWAERLAAQPVSGGDQHKLRDREILPSEVVELSVQGRILALSFRVRDLDVLQ